MQTLTLSELYGIKTLLLPDRGSKFTFFFVIHRHFAIAAKYIVLLIYCAFFILLFISMTVRVL